jgi:transcription initiation factor TFIID TATA-box-binding protein
VPFYRSGKCSIVGATSPEHFEGMVERVNTLMRELLEFDYEPTAEIKNIVVTTELESIPQLETVSIGFGLDKTEYEPEQFPGLIYRNGDVIVLIFANGKIVCTGLSDFDMISSTIDEVTEKIESLIS